MTEHDLFSAIGGAEDTFFTDSPNPRILPLRRLGLIAAVLSLLIITACAAPTVIRAFDALTGGSAELTRNAWGERKIVIDEETGMIISMAEAQWHPAEYTITLKIASDPNAPQTLLEYYLPTATPENYTNRFCSYDEALLTARFAEESTAHYWGAFIEFQQRVLPQGDPVVFTDYFDRFSSVFIHDMQSRYVVYGEANVLELVPEVDEAYESGMFLQASRYLYWSDGAYLFRLEVPYEMEAETITQIIRSVQTTEDVDGFFPENE